jgi:hypothetical protein
VNACGDQFLATALSARRDEEVAPRRIHRINRFFLKLATKQL